VIFLWPMVLWSLAVVPLLIAGYLALIGRKRRVAAQYAAWMPPGTQAAARGHIRDHIPAVLLLVSIIALIGAMARPNAVLTLPSRRDTVILAIDVSGSMKATDLQPTRLAAAQEAANDFIKRQPKTTQIGIVAFAGTALVVQRPTTNREDLLEAVKRLQTQDGTTVGGAIVVALQTLFPKEEIELIDPLEKAERAKDKPKAAAKEPEKPPAAPGSETSAAIVLLTDGQATAAPDPIAAAHLAAEHGVRVFTVGVGTVKGEVVKEHGISMRVQLDEENLKKIADITRARYFQAGTATDLRQIYRDLNARLVTETRETEVSAFFVAVAAVAALLGAALSLLWFHRIA
jgi:Ca-activated chloride channel family protein